MNMMILQKPYVTEAKTQHPGFFWAILYPPKKDWFSCRLYDWRDRLHRHLRPGRVPV